MKNGKTLDQEQISELLAGGEVSSPPAQGKQETKPKRCPLSCWSGILGYLTIKWMERRSLVQVCGCWGEVRPGLDEGITKQQDREAENIPSMC